MSADNDVYLDEIVRLRDRLADIERAAGVNRAEPTYTTAQLEDRAFYKTHEADILRAAREPGTPRIVESEPLERPARVAVIDPVTGWEKTGVDTYLAPAPAPKVKGQKP
jgi:hypothetical protein